MDTFEMFAQVEEFGEEVPAEVWEEFFVEDEEPEQ